MKKFLKMLSFILVMSSEVMLQGCGDDEDPAGEAPTVTLSAASAGTAPGQSVKVTVTVAAPNGVKSINYTTTGNLAGSPTSPIATTAETQEITFTVPANAALGSSLTAII